MKKIFLLWLSTHCLCSVVFAQHIDTSATNISLKNKLFNIDSVSFNGYEFAKNSPFNINDLMPAKYSSINLGYVYAKGTLMAAQDASKFNSMFLKTEGITKLKQLNLWGSFSYTKTFEDSTIYNHQTRNTPTAPYYFGSPINSSYERVVYNLKTLAEKNLINKNLPIGVGADYRIGNHFSTNDPRGSVNDFQLNLVGTLGYTFFDQLKIGAAYRYGYGQERFNIAYKSTSYSQVTLLPAYYNYLIEGYGEAYIKTTAMGYKDDQKRSGIDGYLNFTKSMFGDFYFTYAYLNEKQRFLDTSSEGFTYFDDFDLKTNTFSLLWLKHLKNSKFSAVVSYANTEGKDLNYVYMANNYIYNHNSLSLKTNLSVNNNNNIYNYFINTNQYEEQRKDGLTGNDVQYNRLDLHVGFGYNRIIKNNNILGFSLTGIYNIPLNNYFNIPAVNIGQFTQRVIYFDYIYNTSTRLGGSLTADYSFKVFNEIQAGLKASATYLNKEKVKDNNFTYSPGKDRFSSNISLNLYF
ncbi:DUF6850 family outer membrane beta-barrel protein [Pedobacter sp. 22226]|uniref:DUF6850 family outer membrane beta-barrel protein n=1 Tax=Pedobacter sp. 22226 TaxID=3453894 RepID=UPI003F86FE00